MIFPVKPKLPWDYTKRLIEFVKPNTNLLIMNIENEEFTLSLDHDFAFTAVTAYKDSECANLLERYGICVKEAGTKLDFEDETFDLVLNYQSEYDANEVKRVLKKGGHFITEQIGARDMEELEGFKPKIDASYNLENKSAELKNLGFKTVYTNQAYPILETESNEYKLHRFIIVAKKMK